MVEDKRQDGIASGLLRSTGGHAAPSLREKGRARTPGHHWPFPAVEHQWPSDSEVAQDSTDENASFLGSRGLLPGFFLRRFPSGAT